MNRTLTAKKLSNNSDIFFTPRSVYKIVFLNLIQIYFINLKIRIIETTLLNKVN